MIWKLIRWFLFKFDAETAHRITVRMIRLLGGIGKPPLRWVSGGTSRGIGSHHSSLAGQLASPKPVVFGMEFQSRVGLAAGFDKDAEIIAALPELGFGFAEIGTVTPRPQPGNDRPRLFRDPSQRSVFNRMGFNGLGATVVSERLARERPGLPKDFRVGVNIGKNKDTPLEAAAQDYSVAISRFEALADYVVINVSSPNTPGLRSLQTSEALKPIVDGVNNVMDRWKKRPPLLLKLAPELQGDDLALLLRTLQDWKVDGWVLTNTLAGIWEPGASENRPKTHSAPLSGGWSGSPLTEQSRQRLIEARSATSLPIISVGGIMDENEALTRLELGAELVQIYSGWIFGGPGLPRKISQKTGNFRP